jgi:hypothetical protein
MVASRTSPYSWHGALGPHPRTWPLKLRAPDADQISIEPARVRAVKGSVDACSLEQLELKGFPRP